MTVTVPSEKPRTGDYDIEKTKAKIISSGLPTLLATRLDAGT